MSTTETSSETTSSPTTYQCIVCQITTGSMSVLHRHQTYRHTSEELSLSAIGLQCAFINNINANNSIVYDNTWLCDPTKQAEFYTVSATLLNDSNNNASDVVPIDYVLNKQRLFKNGSAAVGDHQKTRITDSRIDCNQLQRAGKTLENFMQIGCRAEENIFDTEELEEVIQTVAIGPDADSFPKDLEKFQVLGREVVFTAKCLDEVKQAVKSITIGTEENCSANYPEEFQVPGRAADFTTNFSEELKQAVNFIAGQTETDSVFKYSEEFQDVGREVVIAAKSPEEVSQAVQFVVIDKEADCTSKSPENEQSKVFGPAVNSVSESQKKDAQNCKVLVRKMDCIPKATENGTGAKNSKFIGDGIPKIPKKDIKVKMTEGIGEDLKLFHDCIEGLCNDLEFLKNKPKKRKRTPGKNPAPRKVDSKPKPKVPRKRAKTSHTALDYRTIVDQAHQKNQILPNNDSTSVNCVDRNFGNLEAQYPVKQEFVNDDLDGRLAISGSNAESREIEISPYDCTIPRSIQSHLESEIDEKSFMTNENFIQNHLETYDLESHMDQDSLEENPVAIKSEIGKRDVSVVDFENNDYPESTENSSANVSSECTFPWYPPDINDYSILVLDPDAHQLVWKSVAIVDEQLGVESGSTQETPILPELTEADLLDSEICENLTISSGARFKESGNSSLQSPTKKTARNKKKRRTNYVLRPRRGSTKSET